MDITQAKKELEYLGLNSVATRSFSEDRIQSIRIIINNLLNQGIYHDVFIDIIEDQFEDNRRFDQYFAKLCKDFDVPYTDDADEAVFLIIQQIMQDIISGKCLSVDGVDKALYAHDCFGKIYDLWDWYCYYWSYEFEDDNGEILLEDVYKIKPQEIDREVMDMANEWLENMTGL